MEELLAAFLQAGIEAGLWAATDVVSTSAVSNSVSPKERLLCETYEPEQLLRMSSELIAIEPREPKGYFIRGMTLHMLGNCHAAIDDLRETIRLQPDHARAWLLLSEAYFNGGEYNQAREARQRALELDSSLK